MEIKQLQLQLDVVKSHSHALQHEKAVRPTDRKAHAKQQITDQFQQQLWRWPVAAGMAPPGVSRAAFAVLQVGNKLVVSGGLSTDVADGKGPTTRVDVFDIK